MLLAQSLSLLCIVSNNEQRQESLRRQLLTYEEYPLPVCIIPTEIRMDDFMVVDRDDNHI